MSSIVWVCTAYFAHFAHFATHTCWKTTRMKVTSASMFPWSRTRCVSSVTRWQGSTTGQQCSHEAARVRNRERAASASNLNRAAMFAWSRKIEESRARRERDVSEPRTRASPPGRQCSHEACSPRTFVWSRSHEAVRMKPHTSGFMRTSSDCRLHANIASLLREFALAALAIPRSCGFMRTLLSCCGDSCSRCSRFLTRVVSYEQCYHVVVTRARGAVAIPHSSGFIRTLPPCSRSLWRARCKSLMRLHTNITPRISPLIRNSRGHNSSYITIYTQFSRTSLLVYHYLFAILEDTTPRISLFMT